MHRSIVLTVVFAAACGTKDTKGSTAKEAPKAAESGCAKDTDCKGDRVCERGQCVAAAGKGAEPAAAAPVRGADPQASDDFADDQAANAFPTETGKASESPPAAAAGGTQCDTTAPRIARLLGDAIDDAEVTQACKDEGWSEKVMTCAQSATTKAAVADCMRLAYADTEARVQQQFASGEGSPKDGDFVTFREGCGFLMSKPPGAINLAAYVLCDGKLLGGPYVTREEFDVVADEIRKDAHDAHELKMRIINNFPTGRPGRVRVVDQYGNTIRYEQ